MTGSIGKFVELPGFDLILVREVFDGDLLEWIVGGTPNNLMKKLIQDKCWRAIDVMKVDRGGRGDSNGLSDLALEFTRRPIHKTLLNHLFV